MRAYFDNEKRLGTHTRRAMWTVIDAAAVDEEMSLYRKAVICSEGGKVYDNEIFYHESCIYLDVLKKLLDDGYFTWLVYDAFYSRKIGETQDNYEKYVKELVETKANNYIGNYR